MLCILSPYADTFIHNFVLQICCNACKVGQQIAQAGGKCSQPMWGSMSDQVRHDCCFLNYDFKEDADENVSAEDEEPEADYMTSCGDHDCSHKCEMRNGTETCLCEYGFHLAHDGRTCLNGIADPIRNDDCEKGLRKNYEGECEDIDECREGTHSCQSFETCVNIFRAFKCMPECDKGFRFNTETTRCEGE